MVETSANKPIFLLGSGKYERYALYEGFNAFFWVPVAPTRETADIRVNNIMSFFERTGLGYSAQIRAGTDLLDVIYADRLFRPNFLMTPDEDGEVCGMIAEYLLGSDFPTPLGTMEPLGNPLKNPRVLLSVFLMIKGEYK